MANESRMTVMIVIAALSCSLGCVKAAPRDHSILARRATAQAMTVLAASSTA